MQLLGVVLAGSAALVLLAALASVQQQQASVLMSPVQSIDMEIYQDEQRLRNDLALRKQMRMQVNLMIGNQTKLQICFNDVHQPIRVAKACWYQCTFVLCAIWSICTTKLVCVCVCVATAASMPSVFHPSCSSS